MSPLNTLDVEDIDTAPIMPTNLRQTLNRIREGYLSQQILEYAISLGEGRRTNLEQLRKALFAGRNECPEAIEIIGDLERITVTFPSGKIFLI